MPRTWVCCRPAAEMAACSRSASLLDIFWRFLMMTTSIPKPLMLLFSVAIVFVMEQMDQFLVFKCLQAMLHQHN